MDKFFETIAQRTWLIDAFGAVVLISLITGLILISMHLIGHHLHDFFSFLKKEAKDFAGMKPTLGAINFLMVAFLLLFGVLVVIGIEAQKVIGTIAAYVGTTKADIFAKSVDLNTLFYVLAAVIVISVLAVAVDNRRD